MQTPAVEIAQLRFRWPGAAHDALRVPALRVERGQKVFLHGPSGSGKSTLLALLAGVLTPTAGGLHVLGQDLAALPGAARDRWRADHVGYVFQQFNLLPYLDLVDNVLLPCRVSAARAGRARSEHGSERAAARALLDALAIPDMLWRRSAQALSVGQQQRVAVARALIGMPELVIADEPTSALDAALRDRFLALLLAASRQIGCAVVFVSHDMGLAAAFDRALAMDQIQQAAPAAAQVVA